MRRLITAITLSALTLSACSKPLEMAEGGPKAGDCRTVALRDDSTNAPVVGAEDLVADEEAGLIYVSAYDRFALEDAIKRNDPVLPRGGLYAIPLEALLEAEGEVSVRDLLWPLLGKSDIRTHGIDLYAGPFGTKTLAAVVHRYAQEGKGKRARWKRYSGVETFSISEGGIRRAGAVEHEDFCQANDVVAVSHKRFLVTKDHGTCGGWMWTEDVLGLHRAEVLYVEMTEAGALSRSPVPVIGRIGFANGIAIDGEERRVIVAATRQKSLLIYDLDRVIAGDTGRPVGRIALPGGPDNISIAQSASGAPHVLAAVHPSLMDMGYYRKRWFNTVTAPSRIVRVDMGNAERSMVYDDETGEAFPAVTAAVKARDHVIMGSVGAAGLRVCKLEGGS